MPEIKLVPTPADQTVIRMITDRAERLWNARGYKEKPFPRRVIMVDIAAYHLNQRPLDLQRLLLASEFEFCHDVFGIHREIDRTTTSCGVFEPRHVKENHAQSIAE